MVKMRVKELKKHHGDGRWITEDMVAMSGQIRDFVHHITGYMEKETHWYFNPEWLEPVEEVAAPTSNKLPEHIQSKKTLEVKQEDEVPTTEGKAIIGTASTIASRILLYPDDSVFKSSCPKLEVPAKPIDKEDPVRTPQHYQFSKYEPIKVIQAWDLSFALGNVVKYIARAGRKDSSKLIEDLEKAKRYLELELEDLRSKE